MERQILIKVGKPVLFYRGTEPKCLYCERCTPYATFECKHPNNSGEGYNHYEYEESCTELEWIICPLNPLNRKDLDQYGTAKANGFNNAQAEELATWSRSDFVKRINDLVPPRGKTKIWIFVRNKTIKEKQK